MSEGCAAFSIFDKSIDTLKKLSEKMLRKQPEKESQKKYIVEFEDLQHILGKSLPLDLLGANSKNVFKRFNIPEEFFKSSTK